MNLKEFLYDFFEKFRENWHPVKQLRESERKLIELEQENSILRHENDKIEKEYAEAYLGLESRIEERARAIRELRQIIEQRENLIGHQKQTIRNQRRGMLDTIRNFNEYIGEAFTCGTKEPVLVLNYEGEVINASESAKRMLRKQYPEGIRYDKLIRVDEEDEVKFKDFLEGNKEVEVVSELGGKREGLILERYDLPSIDVSYFHLRLEGKEIPTCVCVRARKSRGLVRRRFERAVNYIGKMIDELSNPETELKPGFVH